MNAFSNLLEHLKKGKKQKEVPHGYCPNCWGRLEYGGEFYKAIKEKEINLNNIDAEKGWIQGLAGKYLYGIELKKRGKEYECNTCNVKYELE